jgi:hypothetical protein
MATAAVAEESEKTPAERLYEAARDSDVAALDALLPDVTPEQLHEEHEFDFDGSPSVAGATPLLVAAWRGNDAVVRRLIAAGADAALGSSEVTPLMAAVAKNHHGCAVALLAAGADVNDERGPDNLRYRAIHVVVGAACTAEIIRLLLINGADVDAVAFHGSGEATPLSLAFCDDHPPDMTDAGALKQYFLKKHAIAFVLLRAGADVSHMFEERHPPHPSQDTQPLVSHLATDRQRTYVEAVHAAGGFPAYANNRQCQLLTIKLLARGHGRLNLPEALIPTVVSYWDKPWVLSFDHNGLPV